MKRYTAEFHRDGDGPLLSQCVRTLAARDSEQLEDELSDWLQSIHRLCSRRVSLVRAGDRVLVLMVESEGGACALGSATVSSLLLVQ